MATSSRTIRSNAAPAGRTHEAGAPPARPDLHVVTGNRNQSSPVTRGVERLFTWTRTRKAPMLNVVIAMVFLAVCLVGSLTLRTQMAQQAFEQTQVQGHIATLTQDVEDDQAKLDELQASLPRKAQDMRMVPQQGSIAIDLNGYVAANQKERR